MPLWKIILKFYSQTQQKCKKKFPQKLALFFTKNSFFSVLKLHINFPEIILTIYTNFLLSMIAHVWYAWSKNLISLAYWTLVSSFRRYSIHAILGLLRWKLKILQWIYNHTCKLCFLTCHVSFPYSYPHTPWMSEHYRSSLFIHMHLFFPIKKKISGFYITFFYIFKAHYYFLRSAKM